MKTKFLLFAILLGIMTACSKDETVVPKKPSNTAPVAIAGEDQRVEVGAGVKLNAGGSTDADGDELAYHWAFTSKPEESSINIISEDSQKAEFTLDKAGTYEVVLEVNDGTLKSMDTLVIRNETIV